MQASPRCDRFHLALRGRSAVGSAEPCQGSGRRFEPGRPLSKSYKVSSAKAKLGRMAERRGSGLQIPLHGFKSRSDLHKYQAAGGLDKIPPQLLTVKDPAANGITTASPRLTFIFSLFSKTNSPSPVKQRKIPKPASTFLSSPVK